MYDNTNKNKITSAFEKNKLKTHNEKFLKTKILYF